MTGPAWGSPTTWHGLPARSGEFLGFALTIVIPSEPLAERPWIWKTEFLDAFANAEEAMVRRGFHLVYLEVLDHYGSPPAVEYGESLHAFVTTRFQLAAKVCLLGLSRGGLWAYNWAIRHPEKVALIVGDNPVVDFKNWPGGLGEGPGSPEDWQKCLTLYGLTEEEATSWPGNPVDNLSVLARAGIPILHVIGDADEIVLVRDNSDLVKARYRALGGAFEEIVKRGGGHHPHGLPDDPAPLVDFYLSHYNR